MQKCCAALVEERDSQDVGCNNQIHEAIIKNFSSVCLCEAGCDKKNLAVVLLSVNATITYTFAVT